MSAVSLESLVGANFRSSPGIESYWHALLLLSPENAVCTSMAHQENSAMLYKKVSVCQFSVGRHDFRKH